MKLLKWLEDRTGLVASLRPTLQHPVPPDARWMYVFGTAILTSFVLQAVTGATLAFLYVPGTAAAYPTLQAITQSVPFGRVVRGMHYFGASAMFAFIGVHLVRVYLTAAYKYPRQVNWLSGVVLLLLTALMGYTGQVLRWDRNALWTLIVAVEQAGRVPVIGAFLGHLVLGGKTLGADTLSRFFALHVFVVPGLIAGLIGLHVFLVLRNGISEPPRPGRPVDPATYRPWYEKMLQQHGVPFWPNAAWRDSVFSSLVIAGVVVLAWTFGPPALDRTPDPTQIQVEPRPDWYFLFYFALLALMPHGLENFVMIAGPLLLILVLFLLPLLAPKGERAPSKRPWAVVIVLASVTILFALTRAGLHANWSPRFHAKPLPAAVVASSDPHVVSGAQLFSQRACIYCHRIEGHGGRRGPELTHIGRLRTRNELVIRILNGGYNMPSFGAILRPGELEDIVAFLQSRR